MQASKRHLDGYSTTPASNTLCSSTRVTPPPPSPGSTRHSLFTLEPLPEDIGPLSYLTALSVGAGSKLWIRCVLARIARGKKPSLLVHRIYNNSIGCAYVPLSLRNSSTCFYSYAVLGGSRRTTCPAVWGRRGRSEAHCHAGRRRSTLLWCVSIFDAGWATRLTSYPIGIQTALLVAALAALT